MTHYFSYIERRLKTSWRRPILSDYASSDHTGCDIYEKIECLHLLFAKAGLEKGDRAALYGPNSSNWAIACLATGTYGAVAVPLLSDFRPEDAASLVRHSEASVLFVQKSAWGHMDASEFSSLRLAVSLDELKVIWSSSGGCEELTEAVREAFEEKYPFGVSPGQVGFDRPSGSELAVINYTSGTTSAPKGVMLTYDNFNSVLQFALDRIPPRTGDRIVSILPMAHMYGFMFEFLYPFCGGVHIHFLGRTPTPALLSKALKDVRPYLLITVPLVMEKIFRNSIRPVISRTPVKVMLAIPGISQLIRRKIRNSVMEAFGGNVREIVMGGAPLNPEVERWFRKLRLPYTVGYGMTEAAPLMAYEDWDRFAPGSCGKAVDRCRVRIDSTDPAHVAGEIQAKGGNIMKGYFRNPDATAAAFTEDGWLRTGDLGVIDADGNIFIRGRIKSMILSSNGQNIYPEEVEAVMNSVPGVVESLVVSRGTGLTALVYMGEEGGTISAENLQKINSRLPAYSRISAVETVKEPFEKTPKQSIKRFLYSQ